KTKRELGSFNMDGEGHFPTQKFTPEKWNAVKSSFHAIGKHFRKYLRSFGSVEKSDKIPGGLADDKKPSDFDSKQIKEGIKTELEHTKDKDIAQEIAMDHLTEDPKYYDKLKIIHKENKLAKSHPLAKSIPNGWMYVAMDGDD